MAVRRYEIGNRPPAPKRTFKGYWDLRCEDSWRRALYLFSAGKPGLISAQQNLGLGGFS